MVDDLLSRFTEQPLIAVAIVIGIIVIALARFTNAWSSLREFLLAENTSEHWFFGWLIQGVSRHIGRLIILQLIFGFVIYPIVVYYALLYMTIPGSNLDVGAYRIILALKWIVAFLSILIAFGSWRLQYRRGVIQGSVIPILAWLILTDGTRFLAMRDIGYLLPAMLIAVLSSLFIFLWFGIRAFRSRPRHEVSEKPS